MRAVVFAVIGVLMGGGAATAQWLPQIYYSEQNQVLIHMDLPAEHGSVRPEYQPIVGAWVSQTDQYFAGWAFNCNGRAPIISLQRWDPGAGSMVDVPATVVTGIFRPDVARAFEAWPCRVTEHSGWHVYPAAPLPPGAHYVVVKGYAPGGTYVPGSGAIQPASGHAQRFVVVMQ